MPISCSSQSKCPGKSTATEQTRTQNLSWQSPTVPSSEHGLFGSNVAAQQRQSRSCFTSCSCTLAGSLLLLCQKDTALIGILLQEKPRVWPWFVVCKRHPKRGLKPFAITESYNATTSVPAGTQLKLCSWEYQVYWKYSNSSPVAGTLHCSLEPVRPQQPCLTAQSKHLSQDDRCCSALSKQLSNLLGLTNPWWGKGKIHS